MQTFCPEGRDIVEGFHSLDNQRLGKQRVETYQILRTLLGLSEGWSSHPATVMWTGWEGALAKYGEICCLIWIDRGFQDTLQPKFTIVRHTYEQNYGKHATRMPEFLDALMVSHRSNLIRKLPSHYKPFWPETKEDLPYFWPGITLNPIQPRPAIHRKLLNHVKLPAQPLAY